MAGVRCPMCSHLNWEDAEICEVCGARLKPLRINQPPGSSTAQADSESPSVQDAGEQQLENDWLARIRKEAAQKEADYAKPELVTAELKPEPKPEIQPESRPKTEPESSETDWISRFRTEAMHKDLVEGMGEPHTEQPEQYAEQPETHAEQPEPHAEQPEPHADQPELHAERLESYAERLEPHAEQPELHAEQPEPHAEQPEPHAEQPEPHAEQPEPIKRRHEQQSDSESFFASIESDQVLDRLREMNLDIPEEKEESPERIEELPVEENPFENLEEKEASGLPPAEVPDLAPAEVPEWLARIRARKISEAGPTKPLSLPEEMDWTDKLHEKEVPVAPVVEVETPEAEAPLEQLPVDKKPSKPAMQDFDLLRQMLSTEEPAQTAPFDQSQAAEEQEPAESIFAFEEAGKDVEKLLSEDILEDENRPQWLRDLPPEPPIELPHIPALVDESEQMNGGAAAADVEIAGVGLPSWLEDLEKGEEDGAAEEAEPSEPEHHLAPATLPAWLEAMRPVETFGSLIADEEEKAEAVEVAGPLAGLQGVLSAEPVVAMPRTPIIGGAILDVTEREYARAEVLRRMIEDEEKELPAKSKRIAHAPITRWAISLTMLLAILLPYILGIPSSPPPIREPNDMASLIALIDNLPIDRPTLLVFDYDPGYSGELEAVAGSPLNHLILRNMPIVTLSTRPEGPLLAARLLEKVGGAGLQNGVDYLHLGYLSGGATAVQLFAAAPRQAIVRGFQLPENLNGNQNSAWSMEILKNITDLSDFSMVIVITSGVEDARTWAEQAGPRMGSAPLVMILSAGVETFIRPYYETADKQVDGILSGLPAAVAYDKRFQRVGEPQLLWNAFGSGILFSSLILIVGGGYGVAVGFWRRRGARRENEA